MSRETDGVNEGTPGPFFGGSGVLNYVYCGQQIELGETVTSGLDMQFGLMDLLMIILKLG